MITEVQSRVVRDATLKSTRRAAEAFLDDIPRKARPCPNRIVSSSIKAIYKHAGDTAAFWMRIKGKTGKKDTGLVGCWFTRDGQLCCNICRITNTRKNGYTVDDYMDVFISRHAVERVSQRLGTIDPSAIRTELSQAVASATMFSAQDWYHGDKWQVLTPHGLALFQGDTMTTWLDNESLRENQKTGWTGYDPAHGMTWKVRGGSLIQPRRET